MTQTTLLQHLDDFDVFLVDQFGVLIDGSIAYPGAIDALKELKQRGKRAIILTNSGKRGFHTEERLAELGFARESYSSVLSSGDVARDFVKKNTDILGRLKVWFHADSLKASPLEGLDVDLVVYPEGADLLVIASAMNDEMTLEQYAEHLARAAEKQVPCLCINPDMEKLTPMGISFGAGRVAKLYQELGGSTEWVGKPYPLIYEQVTRELEGVPANRVLCIGDSPAHDIAGGKTAGFKTALVRTGIHADKPLNDVEALCCEHDGKPDFIIPAFRIDD